jgi:hypothetical protein
MPLRNTNGMPSKHVLSAKRGLPPLRFGFETGMKGAVSSHAIGKSSRLEILLVLKTSLGEIHPSLGNGGFVKGS